MTHTAQPDVPILLVPGYWLGAWAWDAVITRLTELGLRAEGVTLPGLESTASPRAAVSFTDHVSHLTDRVAALGGQVVLVAHSGAGAVATGVADQVPDALARIIYVDSGPVADGAVPNPDLPAEASELPFPGLDTLAAQGVSCDGLTDDDQARFQALAVPHPAGACRTPVRLHDPRRHDVPTTLVCCSIPSSAVREMAASGAPMFAPLNDLDDLTLVDLPTGHWPMLSRPSDLARVIAAETARG